MITDPYASLDLVGKLPNAGAVLCRAMRDPEIKKLIELIIESWCHAGEKAVLVEQQRCASIASYASLEQADAGHVKNSDTWMAACTWVRMRIARQETLPAPPPDPVRLTPEVRAAIQKWIDKNRMGPPTNGAVYEPGDEEFTAVGIDGEVDLEELALAIQSAERNRCARFRISEIRKDRESPGYIEKRFHEDFYYAMKSATTSGEAVVCPHGEVEVNCSECDLKARVALHDAVAVAVMQERRRCLEVAEHLHPKLSPAGITGLRAAVKEIMDGIEGL